MQRHIMTTFREGHLRITAEAYVKMLSREQRKRRCNNCFKCVNSSLVLKKCSACKVARYCGSICQRSAWPLHKAECKGFQRVDPNTPTDSFLLFFSLVMKHKMDLDSTKAEDFSGHKQSFLDLMSHVNEIKNDSKRIEEFLMICQMLQLFVGDTEVLPSSNELLEIFGRMVINSFCVCLEDMRTVGAAIYLGPSKMNHECWPNAVVVFNNAEIHVTNILPISQQNGDIELTISYVDQLMPRAERQKKLLDEYYFLCQCKMCQNDSLDQRMLSTRCSSNCPAAILQTSENEFQPCTHCGRSLFGESYRRQKSNQLEHCRDVLKQAERLKADGESAAMLQLVEQCLQTSDCLHTDNVYRVLLADRAFDACMDCQMWKQAAAYGVSTLSQYRQYYPPFHPNVAIQLMKIGKIKLYLEEFESARKHLQEGEKIMCVTHGADNHLYQELRELLHQCVHP